jgi:hypothetical protein
MSTDFINLVERFGFIAASAMHSPYTKSPPAGGPPKFPIASVAQKKGRERPAFISISV